MSTVIISGTTTDFDTTGYPNPNQPGPNPPGGNIVSERILDIPAASGPADQTVKVAAQANRQIMPSNPLIQFSIGDLQHLGKEKHIGKLVFLVTFSHPAQARLPVFTIQITLPEGKVVYEKRFLNESAESSYEFALDPADAKVAQRYFVLGNRITIRAVSEVEINQGEIKVGVRNHHPR